MNDTLLILLNIAVFVIIGLIRKWKDKKLKTIYRILIIIGIISALLQFPLGYYQKKETQAATSQVDQRFDMLEQIGISVLNSAEVQISSQAQNSDVDSGISTVNSTLANLSPQAVHIVNHIIGIVILIIFLLIGSLIGKILGLFKRSAIRRHGSDSFTVGLLFTMDLLDMIWLFYGFISVILE